MGLLKKSASGVLIARRSQRTLVYASPSSLLAALLGELFDPFTKEPKPFPPSLALELFIRLTESGGCATRYAQSVLAKMPDSDSPRGQTEGG